APIGRGDCRRRFCDIPLFDEASCAGIKKRRLGELMRDDGGDGDDAALPVGEGVGKLGRHGDGVTLDDAHLPAHRAQGGFELGQALVRRAGNLRRGGDDAVLDARGLHMGAANVPAEDRAHERPPCPDGGGDDASPRKTPRDKMNGGAFTPSMIDGCARHLESGSGNIGVSSLPSCKKGSRRGLPFVILQESPLPYTRVRASAKAWRKSRHRGFVASVICLNRPDCAPYLTLPIASAPMPRAPFGEMTAPLSCSPQPSTPSGGTALTSAAISSDLAAARSSFERTWTPARAAQRAISFSTSSARTRSGVLPSAGVHLTWKRCSISLVSFLTRSRPL